MAEDKKETGITLTPRGLAVRVSDLTARGAIDPADVERALTFVPLNVFIKKKFKTYRTPAMGTAMVREHGVRLYATADAVGAGAGAGARVVVPEFIDRFLRDRQALVPAETKKRVRENLAALLARARYDPGRVAPIRAAFSGALRAYQADVVAGICARVAAPRRGRHGEIVSIPCGGGKTVIAIAAICALGRKTVWITPKEFLAQQLRESAEKFARGLAVSAFPDVSGDVVSVIVNTAARQRPDDVAAIRGAGFGLCVIDEAHRIGTKYFSRAMEVCACDAVVGLSATPDRADGGRTVIETIVGPVSVAMDRAEMQTAFEVLVRRVAIVPETPFAVHETYDGTKSFMLTHQLSALAPGRCEAIAEIVAALLADASRKVIVFSRLKDVLRRLQELLAEDGIDAGLYVGGAKSRRHTAALEAAAGARAVLSTFSMGAEGLDIPGINAVVLETPRKDVRQMVGRILRKADGVQRVVVDIRDETDFPIFARSERERDRFYADERYQIRDETVRLADGATAIAHSA